MNWPWLTIFPYEEPEDRERTSSFVGTAEYVPPELLEKKVLFRRYRVSPFGSSALIRTIAYYFAYIATARRDGRGYVVGGVYYISAGLWPPSVPR